MTRPQSRGTWAVAVAVLSAVLAAVTASVLSATACNEATHRAMHAACRPAPFLLAHGASFEHTAPWTSVRGDRPDHPPPVIRGGWLGPGVWRFVLRAAPRLAAADLLGTLLVVLAYRRWGRPRRIGRAAEGGTPFWTLWRRALSLGAWASVAWPALAFLVWVWWYWVLLARMPGAYSQVHIEPTGVLGIGLGALAGYLFTLAAVTRCLVRRGATSPPDRCLGCGYSLVGTKPGTCPECGRTAKPQDSRAFAMTWRMLRLSVSRWRWLPRAAEAAVVLFLLAFPRTVLITSPLLMSEHSFQRFMFAADPKVFRALELLGLGGNGDDAQDVIGGDGGSS